MRYIIVTPLKYTQNEQNLHTVEQLWGLDLETHSKYYKINVFAPLQRDKQLKTQNGSIYIFSKDSFILFTALPDFKNSLEFFCKLPKICYILYTKINKNDIVHCVGTAYPPIGIAANIILRLKKHKKYIFVLDADFITDIELHRNREKYIHKRLLLNFLKYLYVNTFIFCIKTSPLTFVIGDKLQERYQKYGNLHKIYASWIKEENILTEKQIYEKIKCIITKKELKLIFASSLVYKKNPQTAIEIIKILKSREIPVKMDIFGEGPMKLELETAVRESNLSDDIQFKGVVSYNLLNSILKEYDIIIVPNFSGEQPRVIFDAMANGVIVIGSEIESFEKIITNYKNGILCKPNDAENFAKSIEIMFMNRIDMIKMINGGVEYCKKNTMESMHRKRAEIISNTFDK